MFLARHGDGWLADALQTPHVARAAAAFAALARAADAREAWDYQAVGRDAGQALPLFESIGGAAGVLYSRTAQIYAIDRGPECAEGARALTPPLRARRYAWLEIQAMLEEGRCATWNRDLKSADASEREALASAAQHEHAYPVLYLRALGLSASRHARIGNTAAAWRENFSGLDSFWDGMYPRLRAYQFYSALSLFADQNHIRYPAVAWAREAALMAAGHPALHAPALWQLGMAEFGAGLRDAAYRHLGQAVADDPRISSAPLPAIEMAALETSRGELDHAGARLLGIRTDVEKDTGLLRLRYDAELARVQLRRGRYADAARLLEDAVAIGESSWSRAPEADRLLWTRTMGGVYRGLLECRIRTGADPREARELWSRYRARLFEQGRETPSAEPSPAPGEARLTFAELSAGVAVWLETGRGFWFREIDSPAWLRQAADRLDRACASERSPESVLRADAAELSGKLLGPWDPRLREVRTLVVETDAAVASVPWSALVRPNGHYWSADFAVRLRDGAGAGAESRAPLESVRQVLAVGAPAISGEEGLVPLPHAREEAEKVSARFPRSFLLTGKAATWSDVVQKLAAVQLFHFSGHGYGGEGGGLLLRGPEGGLALLRAADIRDLDLSRCRLVVLGGCSTAAGERGGPGDPQSLVRAFLHAGAQDVVAGRWNLDSAGTEALMQAFYEAMLSGEPVAESLRLAAQSVRRDERFAHPYFWAGLEVFSNH